MSRNRVVDIKFFLIIIPLAVSWLGFNSCHRAQKKVDPFYINRGEWDDYEIPLLKPYKLINLNGMKEWSMNLESDSVLMYLGSSIQNIEKANVIDGVICLYSSKTIVNAKLPMRLIWAVIIPSKKTEKGFISHASYIEYLKEIGFSTEPGLYNVEDILKYAGQNDVINWKEIRSNN
ncbi:hypothetical protein A0256_09840 [Mucilaginibacter sp. PAMC 26640]|nr:hypothetical protein A0256_09840 [Mucilaginibacter sp. PAMC 26640]